MIYRGGETVMSQSAVPAKRGLHQTRDETENIKHAPIPTDEKKGELCGVVELGLDVPKEIEDQDAEEFVQFLKIVERYANKFSFKSSHRAELREELFSMGAIALVEAFPRYKSFSETHRRRAISLRIRGEMLDYLASRGKRPEALELFEGKFTGSKRSGPEYCHILMEIRRKLERGFEELNLQERAILKNFLTGQVPEEISKISASSRSKIKQKAFKKLRKYVSLHFDLNELLDFIAE